MSLEYFEGPAGSGKTYNLNHALKRFLELRPLRKDEAVLGITYLHGSRRRMHATLGKLASVQGRFHACTVDSLVRAIVFRWRSLGKDIDPSLDVTSTTPDFRVFCRVGAALLEKRLVGEWLARRYPVVLVDELQDCHGDHLNVIRAIESYCHVIAAADEFQDLTTTGTSEAVEWLRSAGGRGTFLTGNHRTSQPTLLRAANQLRSSGDCGDILKYDVTPAKNPNAGAGGVARALTYHRAREVVILTPTGPEVSDFVKDVVGRLVDKSIHPNGVQNPVGPFRIEWESGGDAEKAALLAKFGDLSAGISLSTIAALCHGGRDADQDLQEWALNQHRLRGISTFSANDFGAAAQRILQSRRAFLPDKPTKVIRAMTINQAKNREFDGVVVLWPFTIGGDLDSHRRKLYNAITRAKRWACVIVQESVKESRVAKPPFSKTVRAAPPRKRATRSN